MFDADAVKELNADAVFLFTRLAVMDAASNLDAVNASADYAANTYGADPHAVNNADAVQEIMRLSREYRDAVAAVFHRENAYGKGAE